MGKIIVGIDPDIDKSGVCVLDPKGRQVQATVASFPDLVSYFEKQSKQSDIDTTVVVEASWMHNKTNWHMNPKDSKRVAAAKGYSVGQNHQTGKLICEMARCFGLKVVEHVPLVKCWKGKDGKITADELQQITGLIGRTNQESRDAALLAWCYANLPMRLKCQ